MKKWISLVFLAGMLLSLAACGEEEVKGADLSGETLEAIVEKIYEQKPLEIGVGTNPVDVNDSQTIEYLIGLKDASNVKEAVISEAMISSQAYSLILARVNDAAKAEETAQAMLNGVDPAKWICVQADSMGAAVYGDLVLVVMSDSGYAKAEDMVAAFKTVCGGTLDKELTR